MKRVEIPRFVEDDRIYWYHSLTFPDQTEAEGIWDMRGKFASYTGDVNFKDKEVLDVGTASGFLAFEVEKCGAKRVGALDLPIDGNWDVVPYSTDEVVNIEDQLLRRFEEEASRYKRANIEKLRNGFFYAHNKFSSAVELYESTIYEVNQSGGLYDVSILGEIILHLRDPFLALHRISLVTKEKIIVANTAKPELNEMAASKNWSLMHFLPDRTMKHKNAWWHLSDQVMEAMFNTLGFEIVQKTVNVFIQHGKEQTVTTFVANRVRV